MRFWYYHATLLKEIQLLDLKHGLESNTVLVLLRQRRFLFGSVLKGKRTWKYNFGIKLTTNMILEEKRLGITATTIGCLNVIRKTILVSQQRRTRFF